jgi:phospholipid/cholesterol/gamma-HCH transport system substrate-binding protein
MSPAKRNILVGITVIGALVALGWMIVEFGGNLAAPFAPPALPISFTAQRADGVVEGSPVLYRGVTVGKVVAVKLLSDNQNVEIDAAVNQSPVLPANLEGVIRQTNVFGAGASVSMELLGDHPQGALARDAKLTSRFAGSGLIPPEINELAKELKATSRQFRESNIIGNLNTQVTKVGKMVDEITKFVSDKDTQDNLHQSLANVKTATESAKRISANLEKFSGKLNTIGDDTTTLLAKTSTDVDKISVQINERLAQVDKLLQTTQSITTKIDKGDGTAGKLVNDPRLYTGLVQTTESLNLVIRDLQRLVEQWEQEGISLKLK